MDIKLKRISTDPVHGTFGVLLMDGIPLCVTLEESWINNKKQISCIPAGKYDVAAYSGTKFKNVWEIKNVPGRSAILIHAGNTEKNTAGCVLVGRFFDYFVDRHGIGDSQATLERLRRVLPKKFKLEIENCF